MPNYIVILLPKCDICLNGLTCKTDKRLGWKLLGNYLTLTDKSPNYWDLGSGGKFDKTSLVNITGAEFFSQCGDYYAVPQQHVYIDQ